MDFFASQELARRNTRRLVFLMVLTVIALIGSIYAIVLAVVGGSFFGKGAGNSPPLTFENGWEWFFSTDNLLLLAGVTAVVLLVVGGSALLKNSELRQGGRAVAEMLGGRRIPPNTLNFGERRILNIVEEMSLASGVPVPPVYVMDHEQGINAFAAGHSIDDAVVGVNRGTIEQLNREELQGVIAHEFSHILNGDMRMSLRMIGLLYGIQAIAIIGLYMFRVAGAMSSGNRNDKGGNPAIFVFVFGIGILAIGSVGLFFARLIKASISRQREYLADASAVQFTRLPDGIAGALKMIGGHTSSSRMQAADAESISHMFFANMNGSGLQSFLATHPPLVPRIQRIEPGFHGGFNDYLKTRPKGSILKSDSQQQAEEERRHLDIIGRFGTLMQGPSLAIPGMLPLGDLATSFPMDPALMVAAIGMPGDDDVAYSRVLLNEVPAEFLGDCREMYAARCIVFAALLQTEPLPRERQIEILRQREKEPTLAETLKQSSTLNQLDRRFRLPIFEIIQGTLIGLSEEQLAYFQETLRQLMLADNKIDLFEFFLLHHLIVHLRRHLGLEGNRRIKYETIAPLTDEVELLLSVIAREGHASAETARDAFNSSLDSLSKLKRAINYQHEVWDNRQLFASLNKFADAAPRVKKELLSAIGVLIVHDQMITVTEAELFRAIAESLDCPVPPIWAKRV